MKSHRNLRISTPWLLFIYLAISARPIPAVDSPTDVPRPTNRSGKNTITVLPGAAFSGPISDGGPIDQLTHLTVRSEPFEEGGKWQALLEFRRIVDERRVVSENSGPDDGQKSPLLSLEIDHSFLYLALGSRFLPGAPTGFLSVPELRSTFSDLPHGRTRQTVFFQPSPRRMFPFPGLFGVKGKNGPGYFLADSGRTFFLAWHPGSHEGALALDRLFSISTYPLRLFTDLQADRKTVGGFLDITGGLHDSPGQFPLGFRLEGQRKAAWDYCDSREEKPCPGRRGKSGLAALSFSAIEMLEGELVGQDIGMDRYRLGGLSFLFRFSRTPLFLILRIRHYLHESSALSATTPESEGEREGTDLERGGNEPTRGAEWGERENDGRRRVERGVASGFQIGSGSVRFRLLLEKKEIGPEAGEIGFILNRDRFQLGLGAVIQRISDPVGVLYLHSPTLYESEGRFLFDRKGALIIRLRSPFLHFYLLSQEREGRNEHYAGLQIRLSF